MITRHFYRCADCLSVAVSDKETAYRDDRGWTRYGTCAECGGEIEYMGRVVGDRLTKPELRCPCDSRCTSAPGPKCECRCGGENHGTNRVVEVLADAGGIPLFAVRDGKAGAKAAEYRALYDAVRSAIRARFGAVIDRKRNGDYLRGDEYSHYCNGTWLVRQLDAARGLRSHAARNRKLQALLAELGAEVIYA